MTDVGSMVNNVLRELRVVTYSRSCSPTSPRPTYRTMSRLNVLDHGNSSGIQIGSDWVDTSTLPVFAPALALLSGNFDEDGFVHFQQCDAGQNRPLLLALAGVFGVPVYAGTGAHNPIYRFNFGDYVCARPNGNFDAHAGRP